MDVAARECFGSICVGQVLEKRINDTATRHNISHVFLWRHFCVRAGFFSMWCISPCSRDFSCDGFSLIIRVQYNGTCSFEDGPACHWAHDRFVLLSRRQRQARVSNASTHMRKTSKDSSTTVAIRRSSRRYCPFSAHITSCRAVVAMLNTMTESNNLLAYS